MCSKWWCLSDRRAKCFILFKFTSGELKNHFRDPCKVQIFLVFDFLDLFLQVLDAFFSHMHSKETLTYFTSKNMVAAGWLKGVVKNKYFPLSPLQIERRK